MLSTTARRWIIGLIVLALASMAPPAGKALERTAAPNWYTIDGAKVSMLATCDGDGLTIQYELTATSLEPKTITVNLSYPGHFTWTEWRQLSPILIGNNPIRSATWRPDHIGQHAGILLDGGAPCDTVISDLTSFTARRYMPRFAH